MKRPVRIGLLGCGTVGAGVVSILQSNGRRIAGRAGGDMVLRRVAVRDVAKARDVEISPDLLTDDPRLVVEDPEIDVVVELMGGVEPAFELMAQALRHGKSVVTANKEVLARHGAELSALAARARRRPFCLKAAWPAAFPSSSLCGNVWPPTGFSPSWASSTAPPTTC